MALTIIVFLLVLSILVIVHEFGHFMVGKMAKIGVLEFALGLPFTRPIFSKKLSSGMKLSLYPLLFGGFVRLKGEEGPSTSETSAGEGKHFYSANVWARIAVVIAGVTMNLILAVVLFYAFLGLSGFKVLIPRLADYQFISPSENRVVVTFIQKDSPAMQAGLAQGDVVESADGKVFERLNDFQSYTKSRVGYPIKLLLKDVSLTSSRTVLVTPRKNPPAGQGPLGLGIGEGIVIAYSGGQRYLSGISYAVDMLGYNLRVLGHLAVTAFNSRDVAPLSENVSGPVGIATAVGTILDLGGNKALVAMVNFVGLLSLSLAFMNILPIPALDGGRLMFLLVEALLGKKMAAQKENLINQIGMAGLLALIVLISFSDLRKIFVK